MAALARRMTLLKAKALRKTFGGVPAVNGVSFTLRPGEMLALIGPNGAGKSTCFNLVGGQLRPDSGRVWLGGEEITGSGPRTICRLGVGRTFQITATFASMTVRENVQVAVLAAEGQAGAWWRPARQRHRSRADILLQRVGLGEQAQRGAAVLAYGDLKRLELAMALANRPRLLLMDEPTAGMAPGEREALMALVRDLATREGIGVLFTEHDMDVVFGVADRILVLNRGELVAEGDPEAIRADKLVQEIYLGGPE